jgi:hypothetical protein
MTAPQPKFTWCRLMTLPDTMPEIKLSDLAKNGGLGKKGKTTE